MSLAATWYEPARAPAPAVILVHMLNKSRRDWDAVAARLAAEGIGALAIDLRGHGESVGAMEGGRDARLLGARPRRDAPPAAISRHAATCSSARVGIAGASIGANLAVLEAAGDVDRRQPRAALAVARLSRAADRGGASASTAAGRCCSSRATTIRMRRARCTTCRRPAAARARRVVLSQAGHGTVMLGRDQDLARMLVDWFRRTLL